jgi:hypothetical protein
MPWGAAIGAVGSIAGGLLSSSSSSSQAADTGAAEREALNMQKSNLTNTEGLEGNTITVGQNALADITDLSGAGGQAAEQASAGLFQASPGYQYALSQGQKAVDNSAAARGLGTSGAEIKGATANAEGLASTDYNNFYNRLAGIAGTGETAIQTVANAGANAANQNGQTVASGQNQLNQISSNQASGIATGINNFANNSAVQNALNSYGSTTSPGTASVVNNFDASDAADILAG